jgi:superkiller protein 3
VSKSAGFVALLYLTSVAFASQFTAFSLKVAQQRIEKAGANWRQSESEVQNLGGINKVEGFVYDTAAKDLILVGDHESDRATLTLDDLVVALRARFRYNKWPLVSIDPTPETKATQMQHVRFDGGIQNTTFGQAMYDADYRLKQMAMGFTEPGIAGLKTYWDRCVDETETGITFGQSEVSSRFWFYPVSPHVVIREGVCVVRGLSVGVFTEVLSAKIDGKAIDDVGTFKLERADAFANDVSRRFDDLCRVQPSYNRLRGLQELVAVSRALEELEKKPDLAWWLEKYTLATTETPRETKVLERKCDGARGRLVVSGGVHLTALAMRLNAGDVGALRAAVLTTRPTDGSLSWQFVAAEWVIPLASGQIKTEDITLLFRQALFLQGQQRQADALSLYEHIIEISPDLAEAWNNKAIALTELGRQDEAIRCCDRALEIDPGHAWAWRTKGCALVGLGRHVDALECFDHSLEINPNDAEAWTDKGSALGNLEHYQGALKCYDRALEVNPECAVTWSGKGEVMRRLERCEDALKCCDRALEVDAGCATAWRNKGCVLEQMARHDEALMCFSGALELDPRDGPAWNGKGLALANLGHHDDALACFDHALELNPRNDTAWYNKGVTLTDMGRDREALDCFDCALETDSLLSQAWYNRGVVMSRQGRSDEEIRCYDRALEISPRLSEAWQNKGAVMLKLGCYDEALQCFERTLEIVPLDCKAWNSKGAALAGLRRYGEALTCCDRALDIDSSAVTAWYNRALISYFLERYSESRQCFERAARLGYEPAREALDKLDHDGH